MEKNETKTMLDLILHPVRMRILMLLSGSQGLTPQQMAERMSDIPQATLYRHIKSLAQAEVLTVAAERPVRGTLEKVYALNTSGEKAHASGPEGVAEFNRLSKEEHQRYFTSFMLTLLDDYTRYLNRSANGPLDLAADGVGYHKIALYLNDEEFGAFSVALNQALAPFLGYQNASGRKKRLFSAIMMPDDDDLAPSDAVDEAGDNAPAGFDHHKD